MTQPDDPDLTTRNRGEGPDGAVGVAVRSAPVLTHARGESPESMTGPVPDDPDEELTHERGESPWTARAFVGLTEPDEPVSKSRGESPESWLRATEPSWPDPESKSRGEDRHGVVLTMPRPRPNPKRTNGRGESESAMSEPLEPRTADRGESPDGVAGSARRPGPAPRPTPSPSPRRTFDRGEAVCVPFGGGVRVCVDEPMTVLGRVASRQAGRA